MALTKFLIKAIRGKAGLVPVKVMVHGEKKTFERTQWKRVIDIINENNGFWSYLIGFFGKKEKARTIAEQEYEKNNIKDLKIDKDNWYKHFLEYFANKIKWDNLFSKEFIEKKQKPESEKKQSNISYMGKSVSTGKIEKFKKSVMQKLFDLYGGKNERIETGPGELPKSDEISRKGITENAEAIITYEQSESGTITNSGDYSGIGPGSGSLPGYESESRERDDGIELSLKDAKINRQQAIAILENKKPEEMTQADIEILRQYDGAGGTGQSAGEKAIQILFSFYTPKKIISKMTDIVKKYIGESPDILDPSAGSGRFAMDIMSKLPGAKIDMIEPDETASKIAKILNPESNVKQGYIQDLFMEGRRVKKKYDGKLYDCVITNPPYGLYDDPKKGFGEGKEFKRYEDYFIDRGLQTLKDGGILCYIIPSGFMRRNVDKIKNKIAEKGRFVEAYRMPNGIFNNTNIGTDILVIRKEKGNPEDFTDKYFTENPDKVLGTQIEGKNIWGKLEKMVTGDVDKALENIKTDSPIPETSGELGLKVKLQESLDNISRDIQFQGSYKQIKWAKDIYKKSLIDAQKIIDQYIESPEFKEANVKDSIDLLNTIPIIANAAFWIENRGSNIFAIAEKYKKQNANKPKVDKLLKDMPELTGTEKQVNYANDIREKQILNLLNLINSDDQSVRNIAEYILNSYKENESASKIIDNNVMLSKIDGWVKDYKKNIEYASGNRAKEKDSLRESLKLIIGGQLPGNIKTLDDNTFDALINNQIIVNNVSKSIETVKSIKNRIDKIIGTEKPLENKRADEMKKEVIKEYKKSKNELTKPELIAIEESIKNPDPKHWTGGQAIQSLSDAMKGNKNAEGKHNVQKNPEIKKIAKEEIPDKIEPVKIYSKEEFEEKYNPVRRTKKETEMIKYIQWDGHIEGIPHDSEIMSVYDNKSYPDYLYATGDISEKMEDLQRKKDSIIEKYGDGQYEKQKELLEKAMPKQRKISEITISPISELAREIEFDDGEKLYEKFIDYIRDASNEQRENMAFWELRGYVDREPVSKKSYRGDGKLAAAAKEKRRDVCERMMKTFMNDALNIDEKAFVEDYYNKKFNSTATPDYTKFNLSLEGWTGNYKNKKFEMTEEQVNAAKFLIQKGTGIVAYDVGGGKTAVGIAATEYQLQSGRSKKPLIAVPKTIYKKWIKTYKQLFPNRKINELGNLGVDTKDFTIEDGTVSIITYQGLENLTFKDETIEDLTADVKDSMGSGQKKSARGEAKEEIKIQTVIGEMAKTRSKDYFIEDLGFDHLTVDETHNFKNVFKNAMARKDEKTGKDVREANEYSSIKGTSSGRGKKMFLMTQYIQKNNNGRNTFLLSATPFTNSPIEIYNILTFVAKEKLKKMGIYSMKEFMEYFIKVKTEWVITPKGTLDRKDVVKSFHNMNDLKSLIQEYLDYKTGEDLNLKRPDRTNVVTELKMSPAQEIITEIEEFRAATKPKGRNDKTASGEILKGINNMRMNSISPVLIVDKIRDGSLDIPRDMPITIWNKLKKELLSMKLDFVKDSPKLKFNCELVTNIYKAKPQAGQIFYMPMGIDKYPEVVKYLVSQGIPKDAIAIYDHKKADKIVPEFNDPNGKIKILIGSDKIKEGISLNGNTAILHQCLLPYNPSDDKQINGRHQRQGNVQKMVFTNYALLADGIDAAIFQKHDEKSSRFDDVLSFFQNEKSDEMDLEGINAAELKLGLIRKPEKLVEYFMDVERNKIRDSKRDIGFTIDRLKNFNDQMTDIQLYLDNVHEKELKEVNSNIEKNTKIVNEAKAQAKAEKIKPDDLPRYRSFKDILSQDKKDRTRLMNKYNRLIESKKDIADRLSQINTEYNIDNIDKNIQDLQGKYDSIDSQIEKLQDKKEMFYKQAVQIIADRTKNIKEPSEQLEYFTKRLLENYTEPEKQELKKALLFNMDELYIFN